MFEDAGQGFKDWLETRTALRRTKSLRLCHPSSKRYVDWSLEEGGR